MVGCVGKMVKSVFWGPLLLLFFWLPAGAETVSVAVGDWPPYTSEHDPNGKIAQTLVSSAFALEGVEVVYHYYPWKRCSAEVESGRVAATLPWYRNEDRMKRFLFNTEPLFDDQEVFFYLKGLNFHWDKIQDLKPYRVGGTIGYYDTDLLEKHGIAVDKVDYEKLNFEKMLAGRIDVYPTTIDVGYYLISKMFPPAKAKLFTYDPKPLHSASLFVMFSRKAPEAGALIEKLDRGLRKLKANGRYAEIMQGLREDSGTSLESSEAL